jgi:catechol 2,3-dioxygenase-like lactoylglutathione lyase family enzyme
VYRSANATLFVQDFDRSVHYYHELLGFRLVARHGSSWAEVEAPGLTIGIHPARPNGPVGIRTDGIAIGLHVDDIDAAVATLTGRGIEFLGRREDAGARFADFRDPDGMALYLVELKTR